MRIVIVAFLLLLVGTGTAENREPLRVVATLPDYAFLAKWIGGDRVQVETIVRGDQDAHFIRPKPSFVMMARRADLLIATGLDLEMWLSAVVDKSGNARVRSGQPGYVAASQGMPLLQKPSTLSRIEGGLHVFGNPHVTVSPLQMKIAAKNIAAGLSRNDPGGRERFRARLESLCEELDRRLFGEELLELLGSDALTRLGQSGRLVEFLESKRYRGKPLAAYAGGWLKRMLALRGRPIVTYHQNWIYFFSLFGLERVGTVEPKPGIPPSPKHVAALTETMRKRDVRLILSANYFDEAKVRHIAESVDAIPVIVPLYVGGVEGASDYFRLFDHWVESLASAAQRAYGGEAR